MWAPITKLLALLGEAKTNLLAVSVAIAVVAMIVYAIVYKQGADDEKASSMKKIKFTLYMLGGINALIWLADYVFKKMS